MSHFRFPVCFLFGFFFFLIGEFAGLKVRIGESLCDFRFVFTIVKKYWHSRLSNLVDENYVPLTTDVLHMRSVTTSISGSEIIDRGDNSCFSLLIFLFF